MKLHVRDEDAKNSWCRWIGHKFSGYHDTTPYGRAVYSGTDGIGVDHVRVQCKCDRCGEYIDVARFHYRGFQREQAN